MAGDQTILGLPRRAPLLTDIYPSAGNDGTFGEQISALIELIATNLPLGAIVSFGTSILASQETVTEQMVFDDDLSPVTPNSCTRTNIHILANDNVPCHARLRMYES